MANKKIKKRIVWGDMIFYICTLSLPVLFFIFNNFVIKFNSLIMAFQKTNLDTGKLEFAGFENFADVFSEVVTSKNLTNALWRSVWGYLVTLVVTTFIPVFFCYYVWKKMAFSNFFKVVLFLPTIISSIITMTIYRFIANRLVPELYLDLFGTEILGLTSNPATSFQAVLFYNLWMSMGGGLLVTLGAMNTVDTEVLESGRLDGTNTITEFWYIVLPSIYRIIFIGFIAGIVSIFTADYGLYGFYGSAADPETWTLGYYFTKMTLEATEVELPFYAAWGIIVSVIVIPVTLFFRDLIYNHGPSED